MSIEATAPETGENWPRPGLFTVRRSGDVSRPLRVFYRVGGTAQNGKDYAGLPGSVTLPAGATSVGIPVVARDDDEVEPSETVSLELTRPADPFTLVVLPDTQYYVYPGKGGIPEMFFRQTEWVVAHKDEARIAFVLHEGDCTDQNTPAEWQRVKAAMAKLDGVVPYALAVGNHDGLNQPANGTEWFNRFFPLAEFESLPSFGGVFEPGRLDNSFHYFTAGGVDWLVLSLEFGPRDQVLDWANEIVARHPDRKVIVLTHTHLYFDNTLHGSRPEHLWTPRSYGRRNNGTEVWEKFLSLHANLCLVFNGHVLGTGVGRLVGVGRHGNQVFQMLANYQTYERGGNGFLRLVTFRPADDALTVRTYSPFLDRFFTDDANQFEYDRLGIFSQPAAGYAIDPRAAAATVSVHSDDVDSTPPAIGRVTAADLPPEIKVRFTEPVDRIAAEDPTRYDLSEDVVPRSVELSPDGLTVTLRVDSPLPADKPLWLRINGLTDRAPLRNLIAPDTEARFYYAPVWLAEDFAEESLSGWQIVDETADTGPSSWSVWEGRLEQFSNLSGPHRLAVANRRGTYALWSDPAASRWTDYAVSVRINTPDDDGIGLLFRYQDARNYYKLELDQERQFRALVRVRDGVETTLAAEGGGYPTNADLDLEVQVSASQITARLDGAVLFDGPVTDAALSRGTIALYAWGSAGVTFDDVFVRPLGVADVPPSVTLTAPEDGSLFVAGATVKLETEVDAQTRRLREVAVYGNGELLGTSTTPPFTLAWTNVPPGDYTLVAKARDAFGSTGVSAPIRLSVSRLAFPPRLLVPPVDQFATEGDVVWFSVRAWGSGPLTYQWTLSGTNLEGATRPTLVVRGARATDAGEYRVVVSGSAGTVVGPPARLRLLPPGAAMIGSLRLMTSNQIALRLVGARGNRFALESSTDLRRWEPVTWFPEFPGFLEYTQRIAPEPPWRFYRLAPAR